MATEQEKFDQILTSLLSTDNDIRSQAKEAYNSLAIEGKVSHLLNAIQNGSVSDEGRQMAAVLLRRLFANEFMDFYLKLPPESQAQLKEQVLLAIQQEQTVQLRHKVCDVALEVATNLIDDDGNNQWPEFQQFVFQCANAPSPVLKVAALQMFISVPVFGQQSNYVDLIKQMLHQSLAQTESYEVRFQAVRSMGALIVIYEKQLADLLPGMLNVIAESVHHQDDDALLKVLINIAIGEPKSLRPQLLLIYEMCMKMVSDASALDSCRQLALEVMVTMAETPSKMVRKQVGTYLEQLVPLILQLMADLKEEDGWAEADEILDEDNKCNSVVAEDALGRFVCQLGGKTILPLVTQSVPSMLASPDWKQRHAALMALGAVGGECQKQMKTMLPQIMDGVPGVMGGVLTYLQDPHPRVRCAACNAIGLMSTNFAPVFEKEFHDRVVPGLLMLLDDNGNPGVQAHAGAALDYFFEDCPKHILTGYLDSLMSKLEGILTAKFKELAEKGAKLVLEQVVTTIATVAGTAEKEFIAYYDRLMPCLKYIIQNSKKDELKLLRGKAIECVSLIGLAVGPEKCMQDASEVMDMLLKNHGEGGAEPVDKKLLSAWSRICKVMGRRFEQYLPLVMGPVMRTASMTLKDALIGNEVEGDVDWQLLSLEEQQNFELRTAEEGFEDQAAACRMLVCCARELKEGLAGYIEEVVKLMVPMLKFDFHDGTRSAAAESMPYLLECASIKGPAFLVGVWKYMCPELLEAIDRERQVEFLCELLPSLARCVEILGAGCFDDAAMTKWLWICDKLMQEHFERATNRRKKHELIEEQLEDEESGDIYVLSKVADVVHALFSTYRDGFLPFFDQIAEHFVNLLDPSRPWVDHQWGLRVFDDIIKFTGPACLKYQEVFLQPLAIYVKDKRAEVRQAAAHGWGILAQFGGEQFTRELANVMPRLVEVVNHPEARESHSVNATENVISAVTKIMKYNPSALNLDEVLPVWLNWLPVIEDSAEAPHVYGYLCDLIEQNHPAILGLGNANIPNILSIFTEAFYRGVIEPSNSEGFRMLSIVRQVQSNEPLFQTVVSNFQPERQQALHVALHAPPPSS